MVSTNRSDILHLVDFFSYCVLHGTSAEKANFSSLSDWLKWKDDSVDKATTQMTSCAKG